MGRDWGRPQRREDGEERPEPWHDSEAPPECGNTFPSNAPPISEIALFWRFPHFARLSFWYDSVNMKMDMHIWWNDTESKRVEHPCTRKKKAPVPLWPSQIWQGPASNRTRVSAMTGWWLTARAITRSWSPKFISMKFNDSVPTSQNTHCFSTIYNNLLMLYGNKCCLLW
jgi:hypothetical protein